MKPTISVQLYSVRDHAKADYAKTIRTIVDMGFPIVETAGFPGTTVQEAEKLFKELGITSPTCHGSLPIGDKKNEIIENAQRLGTKYIITGCSPKFREDFASVDAIKKCAELYAEAAAFAAKFGIQVGYHNHDWEMVDMEGKPAYRWFLESTPDTVLWEADVFWVSRGGRNAPDFVKEIGVRGKAIHFKDGRVSKKGEFKEVENASGKVVVSDDKPFLPAGKGQVDLKGVAAAAKYCEYAVVELDTYEGEVLDAIRESYQWLTANGIAAGKK